LAACTDLPSGQSSQPDEDKHFYINLRDYPAFLKNGFSPADITTTPDLSDRQWKLVEPTKKNKDTPLRIRTTIDNLPKRHFLSPFREKDREYTILIPFEMKGDELECLKIDGHHIPGMYLAWLGDNWAIFLNGVEILAEVHLDTEGQIHTHSNWRNIYFPVDKSLFLPGTNVLAFRIIGAPNYAGTGFYYVGPYYFSDYHEIITKHGGSSTVALSAIYVFVGIYHFLLYLGRRKERHYFYYSLFSVMLGIYTFTRGLTPYFPIQDTALLHRIESTALFAIIPLSSTFIGCFTIQKIRLPAKIYGIICGVFIAAEWIFPIHFAEDILRIFELTAIAGIAYVVGYEVIFNFIKTTYLKWIKGSGQSSLGHKFGADVLQTPLGIFALGSLFLSIAGMIDLIDSLFFHFGMTLTNYGFFVFNMAAVLILVKKFIFLNQALEQSNTILEATVHERTRELEDQTLLAESASRAKTEFLAHMSHEIRTPMNAILGMVEIILRRDIDKELYGDALNIKQAGTNLLSIINDILDISKIESGKLDIVPAGYLLSSLINDVISIIRMRLVDKPILFVVNIDGSLPNALWGDEIRIRQVLINLLSNAVKYTRQGYISFRVSGKPLVLPAAASAGEFPVGDSADTELLHFTVTDTGIGIKESDTEQLFEEFSQFDSHKNRGIEGTGLGLSISRKLARLMGGDIILESVYGEGSTFTVDLPQKIRESTPLAAVTEPEAKSALVFEKRQAIAESLEYSFKNLGVPLTVTEETDRFYRELESGKYCFAFFPVGIAEKTIKIIQNKGLSVRPVIQVDLEEIGSLRSTPVISMPVYTVPLADILNGKRSAGYQKKEDVKFIAPDAKLLIVDDIVTNLKVAEGLLSIYKMNISTCTGGNEAIELIKKNTYDLVFMDHMMPEMDGIETTAAIRSLSGAYFQKLPIIALTANAISGMKELFLEKGFNDYLAKPIEIAKLDEMIARWIPKKKRLKPGLEVTREAAAENTGISIPGVDTAKGIAMTGGTEQGYRSVLTAFRRDAEERLPFLREFPPSAAPDETEQRLFTTHIHALKSAAATIGAAAVSAKAAALEKAGNTGDRAFIEEKLPAFYESLKALTDHIETALVDTAETKNGGSEPPASGKSRVSLGPQLVELKEALDKTDIENIDRILKDLGDIALDKKTRDALTAIEDQVLMSEFKNAIKAVEELL
jgi:signal transduction histidine kinase/CheY-like chemotaxis protein/HPt (histidine-containing phosphotransfer) domain-containing protein